MTIERHRVEQLPIRSEEGVWTVIYYPGLGYWLRVLGPPEE